MPKGDIETQLIRHLDDALRLATHLCGNPVDAEDLVQDAATYAIGSYRGFRGESSFKTWFYRILINAHRRQIRKRRTSLSVDDLSLEAPAEHPADRVWGRQLGRMIGDMVSTLPERQREAVVLVTYQNMTPAHAAQIMQTTAENVRVHLHHGRQKLRQLLQKHMKEVSP